MQEDPRQTSTEQPTLRSTQEPPTSPTLQASEPTTPPPPSSKRSIFIILAIIVVVAAIALVFYLLLVQKQQPQPTPTVELPKTVLALEEPKDQQATTSAQIRVVGKTNPQSLVIAYTETQEETFESDQSGNFSGALTLDEGPNEITFTAFGQDGEEKNEVRSVVYVTEKEL